METKLKNRPGRVAQLPAVLLALALNVGFAAVGNAQDTSSMIITVERPEHCETLTDLRNEMQARARLAVWHTRVSVGTDLGVKLNNLQSRNLRLAGRYTSKRG